MLAVDAARGVALPLLVYFVSRSQPPAKACHRSFFTSTTAVICVSGLGVVRWHRMSRPPILLHARRLLAASCSAVPGVPFKLCTKVNFFQDTVRIYVSRKQL